MFNNKKDWFFMKVFIKLILFIAVFCLAESALANKSEDRDSLSKEQIIKYGQEKLAALINNNRKFELNRQFDSLRYILNINTNDIPKSVREDQYPNASFIKQVRPGNVNADLAKYILSEEKLLQFNTMLVEMNQAQTIKSYLILVNFVPLRIDDEKDFKTVSDVFLTIHKDRAVGADFKKDEKLVRTALEQGEDIVKGVTKPFLDTATEKKVFMGWLKFKTIFKNRKTSQLITTYYPTSKLLSTEDGYLNILKRNIDDYRFYPSPESEVYQFIDIIKRTNEAYSDVEALNDTITRIHDADSMETALDVLGGESYAIFDGEKRIHILKVLSSGLVPDSRQILINNIIGATPSKDFDYLLNKLEELNGETTATVFQPGVHVPIPNPKHDNYSLLSCLVFSQEDAECLFCFGENNYTQLITNLLRIYTSSKKFIEQIKYLYEEDNDEEFKIRKIIWDRSGFLTIQNKPADSQDPVVSYNNTTSQVTYKVKEKIGDTCEYVTISMSGSSGHAAMPITTLSCHGVYQFSADRVLGPFDMVTFTDRSDLSLLNGVTTSGQRVLGSNTMAEIYAPALLLKYASDKRWNKDALRAVDFGVNIATILIPAGNVAYLGRNINYIYKTIEYAIKVGAGLQMMADARVFEGHPKIDSLIAKYNAIVNLFGIVSLKLGIAEIYQTSKFKRILRQEADDYFKSLYEAEKELFDLKNANPNVVTEERLKEIYVFSKSLEDMGKAAGYGDDWVRAIRKAVMEKQGYTDNKIFNELFRTWRDKITMPEGSSLSVINDIHGNQVAHLSPDGKTLHLDAVGEIPHDGKFLSIVEDEYFVPPGKTAPIKDDIILYQKANGDLICIVGACFVKGTLVHTQKGLAPIETVSEGDKVLSYDEKKRKNVWQQVKTVFSKNVDKLVQVVVNKDTIIATPEHPFYTEKGWQSAKELMRGLKIRLASGVMAAVMSTVSFDSAATVYNFTVENTHNYYVSRDGVLVHNDCAVVNRCVNKLDETLKEEFINDFAKATGKKADLLAKIDANPRLLKAWEVLVKRTNLRVNENLLNVIDEILQNEKIAADKLKLALENVTDGLIPGWTGVERTAAVIHKFRNHENFQKVINGLASVKGPRIRRGSGFVLKWADEIGAEAIDMFEFVYLSNEKFAADILLKDGTKIDCKSWDAVKSIDDIPVDGLKKQLVSYFKSPPFEMWFELQRFKDPEALDIYKAFDANAATNHIKGRYQELFQKDDYKIAWEKLKDTNRIKQLQITTKDQFQAFVDDVTSALYNFVKVK